MGLDYSFEMWVPRERLFEAFSAIAHANGTGVFEPLIWPDGRRLPLQPSSSSAKQDDPIPFDSSFEKSLCASLWFPSDEALRLFDEEGQETRKQQGLDVVPVPQENGRYRVGCIYVRPSLRINYLNWLSNEPWLAKIDFTAATTTMSLLFEQSSSVQQFFVDLSREVGAVSCDLDKEQNGCTLLYLDGQEHNDEVQWPGMHPRWLRHELSSPLTEPQRLMAFCNRLRVGATAHERMELRFFLQDADPGLRAAALVAFVRTDPSTAFPLIEVAMHDSDWRVRAVATHLLGQKEIKRGAAPLERMLADKHPEVRIAALRELGSLDSTFHLLSSALLETRPTIENLGVIKTALLGIAKTTFMPEMTEVLKMLLERSDFPFQHTAQENLKIFEQLKREL